MASYNLYLDMLNAFHLAADNPLKRHVPNASVSKIDGKYNITYTVYDKDDHAAGIPAADYLSNDITGHLESGGDYVLAAENAFKEIVGQSDNSDYRMLFQDVANITFVSTEDTAEENDIGVITFGQLKGSSPNIERPSVAAFASTFKDSLGTPSEQSQKVYGDIWINTDHDYAPGNLTDESVWDIDEPPLFPNNDYIVAGTKAYTTLLEEVSHALGIDAMQKTGNVTLPRNAEISTHKYSVTTYNNHPDMKYDFVFPDFDAAKVSGPYPGGLQLYDRGFNLTPVKRVLAKHDITATLDTF